MYLIPPSGRKKRLSCWFLSALFAVLGPLGPYPLCAQEQAASAASSDEGADEQPPAEDTRVAEEITVTTRTSRVATKAETLILETPQAINVVPEEILELQQIDTLSEGIRNVSSVVQSSRFGGDYDDFSVRGFTSDLDGNFRRNGVEVQKFGELLNSNAERIEVLKGPSSILYGRLDPGGVINVVTKQPQGDFHHNVQARGGDDSYLEGRLDSTGPLTADRNLLYRINASYEESDSYRDVVHSESTFVSPVLAWTPNERTRFSLEGEAKREEGVNDPGLFSPDGTFAGFDLVRRDAFLGEESAFTKRTYGSLQLTVDRQLGSSWIARGVLSSTRYDRNPKYLGLGSLRPDGRTVSRGVNFREQDYRHNFSEVHATGTFATGPLEHRLTIGGDFQVTDLEEKRQAGTVAAIDIFDPVQTGGPTSLVRSARSEQDFEMTGLFLQDQIRVGERLVVQLGARLTDLQQDNRNLISGSRSRFTADDLSPQAGVVYLLRPTFSVYGSYSESFAPTLFTDNQGNPFDPSFGEQAEVGVKAELLDGRLTATTSLFRLTKTGVVSFFRDASGVFQSEQGGRHRSEGFELDLIGRPARGWNLLGSYAHLEGEVVTDPAYPTGTQLGGAPRHTGSLWASYELDNGLGFSAGAFHVGERKAFLSSPRPMPAYTTADAAVSFRFPRGLRLQATVRNLLDEEYYISGDGLSGLPGPPRTFQTAVSYDF